MMISIFALGAAAGLAVIWLIKESAGTQPPAVPGNKHITEASVPKAGNGAAAATRAGINPEELPYDGIPPGQIGKTPSVAPTTANAAEGPYRGASESDTKVKAGAGKAVAPLPALSKKGYAVSGAASTNTDELPYEGASGSGATSKAGSGEAVVPSSKSPEKVQQEVAGVMEEGGKNTRAMQQAKPDDKMMAKDAQRRRTPQRIAKDKEIERIKQQADEELKKKTEKRRLAEQARAKAVRKDKKQASDERGNAQSPNSSNGSRRAMLVRCEQTSNLFRREYCKWKVCNGMWGKNGCPSFEQQAHANF